MYYAVRIGHKPGIYNNWTDCEKQVKRFSGASYKKFESLSEAENFIKGISNVTPVEEQVNNDSDQLNLPDIYAFVDEIGRAHV